MSTTSIKFDEDTKNMVAEISALSGYAQNVVKEVLEYMAYSWAIKISEHPETFTSISIPYFGQMLVRFKEDKITQTGEIETEIDAFASPNRFFKKLIGDLHDEGYTELVPMIQRKIEQAISIASSSD